MSELFTTGGGDSVSVKHRVFVAGEKELEMCVIGTGFSRVRAGRRGGGGASLMCCRAPY